MSIAQQRLSCAIIYDTTNPPNGSKPIRGRTAASARVLSFRLVIDSRLTKTFTGIQVAYFRQ